MKRDPGADRSRGDPLAAILELGLCSLLVLAPLPFGSVAGWARAALEASSLALASVWLLRGLFRPAALPPRAAIAGAAGLLLLGLFQAVPAGRAVVGLFSPRALEVRDRAAPAGDALEAERRLLGLDPRSLDRVPSLSLAPETTASAVRTGAALVALLLVAATVAAARGVERLAWALLVSAAFQGAHGTIVLASRHDRVWGLPKLHYLESATGTFVNRNHFAAYLVPCLALGVGLVLALWPHGREGGDRRRALAVLLGREGSRALFAGLLLLLGLGGLLVSYSRAGIAVGTLSVGLVLLVAERGRIRHRVAAALLLLALGGLPLLEIGAERLAARYARAAEDLVQEGARLDVWADTVEAFAAFPIAGGGLGSFGDFYPLFRSPAVRPRYDHAHQELLQFAAETGIAGIALLALLLSPVARGALRALAAGSDPLAAGLAAGLAGLMLHSLVDFPLRIPAVAAVGAVAAGALLGLGSDTRRLRLVRLDRPPTFARPRPVACSILAFAVLGAALAATLLGAGRAREPFDAGQLVLRAVEPSLGGQAPDAASLRALRARLSLRPLDGAARVTYAGALEAVASGPEEAEAAVFHARVGASLAPTTLPVLRGAALILARCGREEEALALVRAAFVPDAAGAARLLGDIAPYLSEHAVEEGLRDEAKSWVAWAGRLCNVGRAREAEALLARVLERWPANVPARETIAGLALGRGGPQALARWVPPDLPLPEDPAAAGLLCYRARVRADRRDREGAARDIERALRLRGEDPGILSAAAEAFEALGDVEAAREHYRRAVYRLRAGAASRGARARLLVRLAQLEDRHGTAADALRAWREVALEFPEIEAASRRVEQLTGMAR